MQMTLEQWVYYVHSDSQCMSLLFIDKARDLKNEVSNVIMPLLLFLSSQNNLCYGTFTLCPVHAFNYFLQRDQNTLQALRLNLSQVYYFVQRSQVPQQCYCWHQGPVLRPPKVLCCFLVSDKVDWEPCGKMASVLVLRKYAWPCHIYE